MGRQFLGINQTTLKMFRSSQAIISVAITFLLIDVYECCNHASQQQQRMQRDALSSNCCKKITIKSKSEDIDFLHGTYDIQTDLTHGRNTWRKFNNVQSLISPWSTITQNMRFGFVVTNGTLEKLRSKGNARDLHLKIPTKHVFTTTTPRPSTRKTKIGTFGKVIGRMLEKSYKSFVKNEFYVID